MENLRGIGLMVTGILFLTFGDSLIKVIARTVPLPQILILMGFGGALVFATFILIRREDLFSRLIFDRNVLVRNGCEVFGTSFMISALAVVPLSVVAAVLQATPIAVTLIAAIFYGVTVGWRRWTAIMIGFAGVLIIVRPGAEGFQLNTLLAVGAMIGLSFRDVTTRTSPKALGSLQLSFYAFLAIASAGLVASIYTGDIKPLSLSVAAITALCVVCVVIGYFCVTASLRQGDILVIIPFRYTRIIFAGAIGFFFFAETIDNWTIVGSAIVIGSGLYALWREHRTSRPLSPAVTAR